MKIFLCRTCAPSPPARFAYGDTKARGEAAGLTLLARVVPRTAEATSSGPSFLLQKASTFRGSLGFARCCTKENVFLANQCGTFPGKANNSNGQCKITDAPRAAVWQQTLDLNLKRERKWLSPSKPVDHEVDFAVAEVKRPIHHAVTRTSLSFIFYVNICRQESGCQGKAL